MPLVHTDWRKHMESVDHAWQRIETWLKVFAPHVWEGLNPGVSQQDIEQKEADIGVQLPEDFLACYRVHNGSRSRRVLLGFSDWYPLLDVVGGEAGVYQDLLQDEEWANATPGWISDPTRQPLPVQPVWRHPLWLTFAEESSSYDYCIDLAPAPDGHIGQILSWDHEDGPAEILFPSFEVLLSSYADGLEAGLCLGQPLNLEMIRRPLASLQERTEAFQRPSTSKPMLVHALRLAWQDDPYTSLQAFREVLQMSEATLEDRFQAYYGFFSLAALTTGFDNEDRRLLLQWGAEMHSVSETHWSHQELAIITPSVL